MDKDIFLKKSEKSKEAAKQLVKKKQYDDATSRMYYSLYQTILYILADKEIDVKEHENPKKLGSHDQTIEVFINEVIQDPRDKRNFIKINKLKSLRHVADYKDSHIDQDLYQNKVLLPALETELVLRKYINEEE